MFKIAKQMRKERKDIIGSKYLRNENGTLKVKEDEIMERWIIYFSSLLNERNKLMKPTEEDVGWRSLNID
mgnify:CR=1 FL=1